MTIQFKPHPLKNLALLATAFASITLFSNPVFSAEPMLSTGGYTHELQSVEMMKMLDADGNHMVTLAEADTYYSNIFESLDKNKDSVVDAKEWAGPTSASKLDLTTGGYSRELRSMQMMGLMDTNGDHKVSKSEFIAGHQAIFAKMDTSSDKAISEQEWIAKHVAG